MKTVMLFQRRCRLTSIKNKKWQSLTQFKEYLEKNTKEKIEYFDGMVLITNKYRYGLAFGELSIKENGKK